MSKTYSWLCGTCLAASFVALPAFAQQSPTAPTQSPAEEASEVDEIVVTGFRQSLAAGLDVKRESDQFVDSIVATDVAKLPDNTIAESLQRVSGVQIRRALGEGTSVSIRGLRQNRTEVNGRSLVGPFGRGRGFDSLLDSDYGPLSLFPSELIARLDVIKLLPADRSDGSLGGTVDIITRRPLDSDGRSIALSTSGVHAEQSGENGFDGSVLYSANHDDTFGFLVNATYSDRPVTDQSFNSFTGFTVLTPSFNTLANPNAADPNRDGLQGSYIADLRFQNLEERRKRTGGNAAFQWRPLEAIEVYGDVVYSHLETERDRHWFSVPLSSVAADYISYTMSDREIITSGVVNQPAQNNTERLTVESDTISGALGLKWTSDDGRLSVNPEVTYARSDIENVQTFVRAQTINRYAIGFDLGDGGVPEVTLPAGLNITNPALYRYSNVFDTYIEGEAEEITGRVDLTYEIDAGALASIDFGAKFGRLETVKNSYFAQLALGATTPENTVPLTARPQELYTVRNFNGLLDGQAPFAESFLTAVPFGVGNFFACQPIAPTLCRPRVFDQLQTYAIEETTRAAYLKLNFETLLGEMPLTGNLGVRYTDTERTADGFLRGNLGIISPLSQTSSTTDWLPSFVAKLEITDELLFRVGAGRVLGLADTIDLSPSLNLNQVSPFNGTAGNPNLEPLRADQFDASLEWYFAPGSALTVGAFYKDIETFIVRTANYEIPPGTTPLDAEGRGWLVTRPVNGTGGSVKGVEVLLQLPFTFLPAPFDGFGVVANYSYIDSETSLTNRRTREALPLEGLSKNNYNLVGYYENGGFGARIAYNYRDRFFDSVSVSGEGIFFDEYSSLDASVRYEFDRYTVYADATNLLDEVQTRYTGSEEAVSLYAMQGTRFSMGINAKF